ncbi:MAG: NTP transferase domain-containing protein [Xanthomonadales bacterium]|nr:NTP transferase domain-containing protein [Xanthomonadales bacterium]
MRAMILAAGRGERLRPLTDSTPKPLIKVGGHTLIEHHLKKLAQAGFREVVINLAYLGDMIREALGDGSKWSLNIHYSQEPEGALDTGGGIFQALPLLGGAPFAVINGDVYSDYPLARLRAIKCSHAHLVLVPNPEHNPAGDFLLQGGYVSRESRADDNIRHTFSGISVYHPRFFDAAAEGRFSVVPILFTAAELKQVTGEIYRGNWHDIGSLERLEKLRSQ